MEYLTIVAYKVNVEWNILQPVAIITNEPTTNEAGEHSVFVPCGRAIVEWAQQNDAIVIDPPDSIYTGFEITPDVYDGFQAKLDARKNSQREEW